MVHIDSSYRIARGFSHSPTRSRRRTAVSIRKLHATRSSVRARVCACMRAPNESRASRVKFTGVTKHTRAIGGRAAEIYDRIMLISSRLEYHSRPAESINTVDLATRGGCRRQRAHMLNFAQLSATFATGVHYERRFSKVPPLPITIFALGGHTWH